MFLTETNIKIISRIVNTLLAMVSIFMISIDIITLLHEPTNVIEKMAYFNLFTMAILNIIPCLLNVIVTLYFGYYGTTHQKSPILLENVKWLSVLLSWTVSFAILSYFILSDTTDITKKSLSHKLNEYYYSEMYRNELDKIQQELSCCGVDDSSDWINQHHEYVSSCYKNFTYYSFSDEVWPTGCLKHITEKNNEDLKRKSIETFIPVLTFEIAVIGVLSYFAVKLKERENRTIKRQQLDIPLY